MIRHPRAPRTGFPRDTHRTRRTFSSWKRLAALLASLSAPLACESTAPESASGPAALRPDPVASAAVASSVRVAVKVVDANEAAVAGAAITWRVVSGDGSVSEATPSDAQGVAGALWKLGTKAGSQSVAASAAGLPEVTITVTALPGPAETVVISPNSLVLAPSDTVRLTAAQADAYGNAIAGGTVEWSVADSRIATIAAATGLVSAVANGSTTVSAKLAGKTATRTVTVQPGAPEVTTNPTLNVADTRMRFQGAYRPRGANTRVWFEYGTSPTLATFTESTSINTGDTISLNAAHTLQVLVAASPSTTYYHRFVGENSVGRTAGAIRSLNTSATAGTELLSRTGLSGGVESTVRVDFDVPSGTPRLEIVASGTGNIGLYLRYNQPPDLDTHNCFNTSGTGYVVCSIDTPTAGRWYALLRGITAFSGVTLRARSTTAASPVAIFVTPTSATLGVGQTTRLTATVTGSTNTAVTWSSSNTVVASVDASGVVTARAAGQATVTAAAAADPSKTAAAAITVQSSATQYSLATTTAGTGTGTITASPTGTTFAAGTVVTLTATAGAGSTFAGWSGACTGTTSPCMVTMDANKTVTATFNTSGGNTTFDGAYVGRWTGTIQGLSGTVSDIVIFRAANGVITVTEPGTGGGTVNASGAANFTGTLLSSGQTGNCAYTGTFTQQSGGGIGATGAWTCTGGVAGNGTWMAVRQSPTSPFIPNGVWIYASWGTNDQMPTDRQNTVDPVLATGDYCPPQSIVLDKTFVDASRTTANVRAYNPCRGFIINIYSCVGAGSSTQPTQPSGGPLVQCATDPLLTPRTQLRDDALVFTDPGTVEILFRVLPQLDLKVFYCKPGTILVARPRSIRMICM